MKKFSILLAVAVLFSFVAPAFATLGPIRVELNLVKPKICAARANTVTAFKVYIRYNVDIKYNDWIKIWFPIDEYSLPADAADIPKSVCDGFGKIDENITDPRFVPNDAYFKKFTHSKLAGLGQVYEAKDYKGSMSFYTLSEKNDWEDVCGNAKARIVKDPSGLGCWMLGTVLPPMPKNEKQRIEKLKTFGRSMSVGYSPSEEVGYPLAINNCKERSLIVFTGITIEAWRKGYNAIDFNTHKTTGIVAPATPGRYCVSVATEPEPEPVESEAFVLPCSDVSDVKIETTNLTDPDSFLSVKFRTGEGGALDQGSSTISLKFSKNVVFPKTISPKSIKVNGKIADWFAPSTINVDTSDKNFNIIKFKSYDDVENMSVCSVDFTSLSQILLPKDGKPITVEVSTSSEPNFVASQPTVCRFEQKLTVLNPQEYDCSSLCFLIPIQGQTLKSGSEISIVFPDGFKFPKTTTSTGIFINNSSVYGKFQPTDRTLKVKLPNMISNTLAIQIKPNCGLRNPGAGSSEISIQIDKQTFSFKFEVVASDALLRNLQFLNMQVDDKVKFDFDFKPSSANPLLSGDWIVISNQGEFTQVEAKKITFNGKAAVGVEIIDGSLKVVVPVDMDAESFVHVMIEARLKHHYQDCISVSTSKGDKATSDFFDWR